MSILLFRWLTVVENEVTISCEGMADDNDEYNLENEKSKPNGTIPGSYYGIGKYN